MAENYGFNKPKIITWGEMQRVILPRIQGYKWALDTLGDLWQLCAPVPNQIIAPGRDSERRIITPSQFAAWWGDVAKRMGYPEQGGEVLNA